MVLSGFVTLCEGFLGCRPSVGLWKRFFNLRAHNARTGAVIPPVLEGGEPTHVTDMTNCGSCLVVGCRNPGLAYVISITNQSHGEPRTVPTCLSRQGQGHNVLGKHQT